MKSYKGNILLSSPSAGTDLFTRSVVLIIDHNDDGAFGLNLNKKNPIAGEIASAMFERKINVYSGGPVERERVYFICKGEPVTEARLDLDEDFYFTEDFESITSAYMEGLISSDDIKIFSGYSGWGPGQLEEELENQYWITAKEIFLNYTQPGDESLWKLIMQNLGGQHLLFANAPEDVSLN